MELSQADRNSLRASQHKLNSHHVIGNIIEHRPQNPKTYKRLSDNDHNEKPIDPEKRDKVKFDLIGIIYKSKFLNSDPLDQSTVNHKQLNSIEEMEYPISSSDVNSNLWLNMDNVEFDKLEWMSFKADKLYQEQLKSTTRFDKEGRAIANSSHSDKKLKDHDDGHDIGSLVNLLDSAYQPQTTYALNVITKIAHLATMGFYDGAFDENIHDILIKNCLLRARHCLDSPNESICQSAIKCLRALLCNTQVDEFVLDRIYPIISDRSDSNMWLQTDDMKSKKFSIEMKDPECVEIDPIQTLIQRTNLIIRFNNLLQVKDGMFSKTYYECILDILIRMARHSTDVCQELCCLLDSIVKLFLPVDVSTGSEPIRHLSIKALKLIRIIGESFLHKVPTASVIECEIPNSIIPVLESYFCIGCYRDFTHSVKDTDLAFKLHIESLRTIKALYRIEKFQRGIESLLAMCQGILCSSINSLSRLKATECSGTKISLDWQYAAHLIDLAGFELLHERSLKTKSSLDTSWRGLITPIVLRWLVDVIRKRIVPHLDVSIAISTAIKQYKFRFNTESAKDELEDVLMGTTQSGENISANFFKLLRTTADEESQLTNFMIQNGRLRDPKGLPSFGQLNYNTSPEYEFKLNSFVDHWSPFILLNTFIEWEYDLTKRRHDLKLLLDNVQMFRYLKRITGYHKLDANYESQVQQSFSAQYEIRSLSMVVLLLSIDYLESFKSDDNEEEPSDHCEPNGVKTTRLECYGNLLNYAISAIGLLCANRSDSILLKDQIFEKILLNRNFELRLAEEVTLSQNKQIKYRHNWDINFVTGEDRYSITAPINELYILLPVYLSYVCTTRYWMLQPLLDYYSNVISNVKEGEDDKKSLGDRWFVENLNWRSHTGELASSSDADIISAVLKFNTTLIRQSSPYNHLVIRHTIEDYLCIIGTIFLHDDMFLSKEVHEELSRNIRTVLHECIEVTDERYQVPFRDASRIIKPLNLPLADYFNKLVDQFEAVSYGDAAFSNFLLLFLAPQSDKIFRKKLFQEKAETCLSQLRIQGDLIWVPRKLLFGRREKDPEIKEIFRRAGPHLPPPEVSFITTYRNYHIQ